MQSILSEAKQLLSNGMAADAEQLLKSKISASDTPPQAHVLYAHSLLQQGKETLATDHLKSIIDSGTSNTIQLCADLAGIFLKLNEYSKASEYFQKALEKAPSSDQLWHLLGIAQFRNNQRDEAYQSFAKAEQFDGFNPQLKQAENAIEQNDMARCEKIVSGILSHFPAHPRASFLLSSILLQNGQIEKAAIQVQRALGYSPYNQNLWNMLAQIQVQLCDTEAALNSALKLVDMAPEKAEYRLLLADIQQNAGKIEDALQTYIGAKEKGADPGLCDIHIAQQQQTLGNHQQAIESCKKCLDNPLYAGSAYWGLSTISDFEATEQDSENLQSLLFDPEIEPEQACQLSFSLARLKERKKDFSGAFKQYQNANALKTGVSYVPGKAEQKFSAIKGAFNQDLFASSIGEQTQESHPTPIFIVGLPRTGSTLTEQILACHSQVEATMELKVMPVVARRAYLMSCEKLGNNSGDISCLTEQELSDLGNYYMGLTKVYRTDKSYFIDKLPPNFQHVGLIKKVLPKAIIIETHRHPMAWGLAVFRQYFATGHDFSFDLNHIAHAYYNYRDLMTHWRQCLGKDIFKVEYEQLVTDTEKSVKQLLSHCGLGFEQACLAPHENKRFVKTASSDQVRKPIYSSALDSWKKYQEELEPLKKALASYDIEI